MALKLYMTRLSPPVRAVLLTSRAIGVELQMIEMDLMAGKHLTPAYLEMNPQHTVPTLVDGDFSVWDSHAISSYLVSKYAPNDSLYPRDLQKKALVDQRLHFDSSILHPRLTGTFFPIVFHGVKQISDEKMAGIMEAYDFVDKFLKAGDWLAGDSLTIADLCAVASISSLAVVVPIDGSKYPRLAAWYGRCQKLPYYHEANQQGLDLLATVLKSKLT
nr:glutathione s-transferase epsilon-1 [Protohermes costalis]